jgi:thioesterase domain-containing protein
MREEIDCRHGTLTECGGEAAINSGRANARVVQLKAGDSGPCLFLVPGTGGRIEGFANFADLLEIPMPVYAIEARGVDGLSDPDSNIEELVKHYIDRIKTFQETGPYFFLGHSFGGMVVFEMAQRLIERDESMGCLILLDTVVPRKYWPLRFLLANFRTRLHGHLHRISTISVKASFLYYFRRILLRMYGLHHIPSDMKIGIDSARVLLANDMVGKTWSPKFYPDKLTLFFTSDMKNLDTVWRNRVQRLETHFANGSHLSLIEWPNVASLATDISKCLIKSSASMTPASTTC